VEQANFFAVYFTRDRQLYDRGHVCAPFRSHSHDRRVFVAMRAGISLLNLWGALRECTLYIEERCVLRLRGKLGDILVPGRRILPNVFTLCGTLQVDLNQRHFM
jgi:hypothetical protein